MKNIQSKTSQSYKRLSTLMGLLLITLIAEPTNAFNAFDLLGGSSDPVQNSLNLLRPVMDFPDKFEVAISTNDPGLNITEIIYFDKNDKRLRMQLYYSILGLDANKGLDIVMDEKKQQVSLQTDNDCKKTSFTESLLPVQLFFSMFDTLTDYKGMEHGLHKYEMLQFDKTNPNSPKFTFFFDTDLQMVKTRIEHIDIGHYDFVAVKPITEKSFIEEDFYQTQCDQISRDVLQEGNSFVSFMQTLVYHLVGIEEDLLTYLGLDIAMKSTSSDQDDDEEFDE